ncbi:MAG TPA: hypothetical protein VF262_07000 [Burkholderiales bacterium]
MAAKGKSCARCGGALNEKNLDRVSAGEVPLKLHMSGLPVYVCAKGHHAPVHGDFMLWLLRELRETCVPTVPAGEAKGMLFKKYHCTCGAELPAKPARAGTYAFDLGFPDSPAFKAELEVAVYQCGSCGKELARSAKELTGAMPDAIVSLNDAAGFPHSG